MSPSLFKRKPKAPSDAEFRGPLDLFPGDRVHYYQQELTLAGVVFLVTGSDRRCQYHFLDGDGSHVVIAVEPASELSLTLERPVDPDDMPDLTGESVDVGDTNFTLKGTLEAASFCIGGIPAEKSSQASCRFFADEDEMEILVTEDWGGYVEVRIGESVHENELVLRRQRDEDEWEIKPPPRIDLRTLNEARRAKELARQKEEAERQEQELSGARAKLAAFESTEEQEDPVDGVALSDIVDPRFHRPEEPEEPEAEPAPAPAPEQEPTPLSVPEDDDLPTLEEVKPTSDPFADVFGESDDEEPEDEFFDPYQEYMETEREEELTDEWEAEEIPPALEPSPRFGSDENPRTYLTDDTTDEFINAGVPDDDD